MTLLYNSYDIRRKCQEVADNSVTISFPPVGNSAASNTKIREIIVKCYSKKKVNYASDDFIDDVEALYKQKKTYRLYRDGIYTSSSVHVCPGVGDSFEIIRPSRISDDSNNDITLDYTENLTYNTADIYHKIYSNLNCDKVKIMNMDSKYPAYVKIFVSSGGFNIKHAYTYVIPPAKQTIPIPMSFGTSYPIDGNYDSNRIYTNDTSRTSNPNYITDDQGSLQKKFVKVWSADIYDIPSKVFTSGTILKMDKLWQFFLLNANEYYQYIDSTDTSTLLSQTDEPYTPGVLTQNNISGDGVDFDLLKGLDQTSDLEAMLYYGNNRRRSSKTTFTRLATWFIDKFISTSTDIIARLYSGTNTSGGIKSTIHFDPSIDPSSIVSTSGTSFSELLYSTSSFLNSPIDGYYKGTDNRSLLLQLELNKNIENGILLDPMSKNKMPYDLGDGVPTYSMLKLHVTTFNKYVRVGNFGADNTSSGGYYLVPPHTSTVLLIPNKEFLETTDRYYSLYTNGTYNIPVNAVLMDGETLSTNEPILSITGLETIPDISDVHQAYIMGRTMENTDNMFIMNMMFSVLSPVLLKYPNLLSVSIGLQEVITKVFWAMLDTTFVDLYEELHNDSAINP